MKTSSARKYHKPAIALAVQLNGIMFAAPVGGGFQCVFDNLKLTMGGK
jgi:hypothetical protein